MYYQTFYYAHQQALISSDVSFRPCSSHLYCTMADRFPSLDEFDAGKPAVNILVTAAAR